MKDVEDAYWIAGPETSAKIEAMIGRRSAYLEKAKAFKEDAGADEVWGGDEAISGVVFKSKPIPPGWRRITPTKNVWVPALKTPEGKAWRLRLDELRCDLDYGVPAYWGDMKRFTPGYQSLGGSWVVTHHPDAEMPADCRRSKASEYWAMREKEQTDGN